MAETAVIWTIGHSNRSWEDFRDLLKANRIKGLADVRRFPGSRRHPQFGQEAIVESLRREGIRYVHFPELGGRRAVRPDSTNTAWRNAAFRGYADYMQTEEFGLGMKRLLALASEAPTAIMCAEALWWQCHRGLIADCLKVRGYKVVHIMAKGKTEEHPYTSAATAVDGRLSYRGKETELPWEVARRA